MKKKIMAIVLTISLLLGVIPFSVHAATPNYVSNGEYVYTVTADDVTSNSHSFGTGASNGKIWTDKSVSATSEGLSVTLSALSQEFVSTSTKIQTASIAADAVFILDITTSMNGNLPNGNISGPSGSRLKGLSDAVNEAIETITKANPGNRIVVYLYGGGQCVEFMPLGHYTISGDDQSVVDTNTKDKYIKHFTSGTGLQTVSGLQKDGASYSKSQANISGTSTQHAIANGVSGLVNSITQETATITSANKNHFLSRKPYVIMMTDGEPTLADRNWNNENPSTMQATSLKVPNGSNTYYSELSALAILSAAFWKDRLDAAYDNYNSALDKEQFGVEWFNIGLGIEEQTDLNNNASGYISALIDPSKLDSVTASDYISSNSNSAKYASTTKYLIQQYAAEYSEKDYWENDAYVYPSSGVGYVTFATTKEKLMNSFDTLAQKIKEASAVKNIPVYSYESEDISSNLVFTDVIGDGMTVDTASIALNVPVLNEETKTKALQTVSATYDSVNGVYKFAGYGTTVAISGQTLTWTIPAAEVAMFEFKDRFNLENAGSFTEQDYISSDPISLNYSVVLEDGSSDTVYFSNAFASEAGIKTAETSVNYFVPGDNPYYFDLTIDQVTKKTTSSTLKTDLITSVAKSTNKTDTAAYVSKTAYTAEGEGTDEAICEMDTLLGNNGKLTPNLKISKTADCYAPCIGDTITYTVSVTNLTQSEITNVKVNDVLPAGLTIVGETTKTVDVPANETACVTFTAMVDEGVEVGTVLENTANISEIDGTPIIDKPEAGCEVEVDESKYGVTYSWTGDIPASAVLPTDSKAYSIGEEYDVDPTYTDGYKVEAKDEYGNVTEKWAFSGWSTPNEGKMQKDGVTLEGSWVHSTENVPSNDITYEFTGDVPDGVVPPVDNNSYVPGQHYDIPEDYKPGDTVPHYDEYGNKDGEYTFDGYEDPNDGVMDEDGVVISGEWSYEEIEVTKYGFTYSWKAYDASNNEVAVPAACGTIPANSAVKYVKNEPFKSDVDTTFTSSTEVKVYDAYGNVNGIWKFSGWTVPAEDKMPENGFDIPGEWHLTEVEVSEGKVTYEFTGDVPDDVVPPVDNNTYAPGQSYMVSEDYKPGDTVSHYDEHGNKDGEYTFGGYDDPNDGVMDDNGVVIIGEWEFTPIDVPKHDVDFSSSEDPEGGGEISVVNGDIIKVVPNGGEWTYGADTYRGSDIAVITVTDDMIIPDPTRDGYEFIGWSVSIDPNGITVLTATWKEKSGPKWVVPVAAAAVIGATSAVVISSTITIASIAIATPIAVIGLVHTAKHIKEMKAENAEEPQTQEEVEIPDTGSNDNALVVLALVLSAATAAVIYFIENKKKKAINN